MGLKEDKIVENSPYYPIFRMFPLTCFTEKTIAPWDGSGKPLLG